MKKTLLVVLAVIVLGGVVVYGVSLVKRPTMTPLPVDTAIMGINPKNATYSIEGIPVTLENGKAETPAAPGSASMVVTEYFGNEVEYDFNQDGRMDTAFLLSQSTGGSGSFFYEVVALNLPEGYKGTTGTFIGDRIAPQSSRIINENGMVGVIEVNYADRNPGEDFATSPTLGKSLLLKFDPESGQLGEVVRNFEGEANPDQLKLTDKTWQWIRTDYADGRVFAPKKADAFSLTFTPDGTVSGTTDCNGVSGAYTAVADSLVFGAMASTMMFCDGSEEGVFNELLGQVSTYQFTGKGELELGLKAGEGTMLFR